MKAMNGYRKLNHCRLAEGEATGHHHSAASKTATLWESDSGSRVLSAPDGTDVIHQEHGPITLPPGDYDVVRVQEYDHFAEEARTIVD